MVPREGECRVHDPSFDMDTEVNLEHVPLLENCIMLRGRGLGLRYGPTDSVATIWTVMRGTVVQAETRWETNATFQSILLHESSCPVFDVLGDLSHGLPWFDELACGLPDLSMNLCSPPDVVVSDFRIFHGYALIVAFLF